eukprot:TRINITY_DN19578_c0_g1_i2.p1 TRINITY_DN19578_c0_g1~~TRINITY_DN19578_c0_g1_i2.p1  ORF type:complete len:120 (+),score=16.21 TRINITY_DN19578_c0_g1_i2:56-361(+)
MDGRAKRKRDSEACPELVEGVVGGGSDQGQQVAATLKSKQEPSELARMAAQLVGMHEAAARRAREGRLSCVSRGYMTKASDADVATLKFVFGGYVPKQWQQ